MLLSDRGTMVLGEVLNTKWEGKCGWRDMRLTSGSILLGLLWLIANLLSVCKTSATSSIGIAS